MGPGAGGGGGVRSAGGGMGQPASASSCPSQPRRIDHTPGSAPLPLERFPHVDIRRGTRPRPCRRRHRLPVDRRDRGGERPAASVVPGRSADRPAVGTSLGGGAGRGRLHADVRRRPHPSDHGSGGAGLPARRRPQPSGRTPDRLGHPRTASGHVCPLPGRPAGGPAGWHRPVLYRPAVLAEAQGYRAGGGGGRLVGAAMLCRRCAGGSAPVATWDR